MTEDTDDERNDTTILVTQDTRKRVKSLAGNRDIKYDTLVNNALDIFEQFEGISKRIDRLVEQGVDRKDILDSFRDTLEEYEDEVSE